jgi:hypothetical protein
MYALSTNPYFRPEPLGLGITANSPGAAEGSSIASAAGATAGSIVGVLAQTGAIAGPVGAVIGAGIGLITTLVSALIANSGCGVTCVETSSWANQAEPLLLQNVQAYFAQPAPRSLSSQQAALANFDSVWETLQQQCSQAGTGDAGQRCISDRQSGACTWKQSSTSPLLAYTQYGEPATGSCWNWFSGYRDPIANDPDVTDDSSSALAMGAVDTTANVLSSLGISSSLAVPLLLAAAVLVGWVVLK